MSAYTRKLLRCVRREREAGDSHEEIAVRYRVSSRTIQRWLAGKNRPTPRHAQKILERARDL